MKKTLIGLLILLQLTSFSQSLNLNDILWIVKQCPAPYRAQPSQLKGVIDSLRNRGFITTEYDNTATANGSEIGDIITLANANNVTNNEKLIFNLSETFKNKITATWYFGVRVSTTDVNQYINWLNQINASKVFIKTALFDPPDPFGDYYNYAPQNVAIRSYIVNIYVNSNSSVQNGYNIRKADPLPIFYLSFIVSYPN